MPRSSRCHLSSLSPEILNRIAGYLNETKLATVCLVNKAFASAFTWQLDSSPKNLRKSMHWAISASNVFFARFLLSAYKVTPVDHTFELALRANQFSLVCDFIGDGHLPNKKACVFALQNGALEILSSLIDAGEGFSDLLNLASCVRSSKQVTRLLLIMMPNQATIRLSSMLFERINRK